MTSQKEEVLLDSMAAVISQQREKFRVEIRKSRIESCLNGKRFQNLPFDYIRESRSLRAENQELPPIETDPLGFFGFFARKLEKTSNEDLSSLTKYVCIFRKYSCSREQDYCENMVKSGVVGLVLRFMRPEFNEAEKLQSETAWLLRNLMTVASEILENNMDCEEVVKTLIEGLDYNTNKHFQEVAWTLVNLATECKVFSRLMIENRLINKLLLSLNAGNPTLSNLKDILALVNTLCNKEFLEIPNFYEEIFKLAIIAKLCLKIQDVEINSYALWIISFLTDTDEATLRKLVDLFEERIFKSIADYTLSSEASLKAPALRIIGNFLAGENHYVGEIIKAGILDKYHIILNSKDPLTRREIYWGLSNIMASKQELVKRTVEHKVFDKVLFDFKNEDYANKREIVFCLSNALITSSPELTNELIDNGVLTYLEEIVGFSEPQMLGVVMEALEKVLIDGEATADSEGGNALFEKVKRSNFKKILEDLTHHPLQKVFDNANYLLDRYFTEGGPVKGE